MTVRSVRNDALLPRHAIIRTQDSELMRRTLCEAYKVRRFDIRRGEEDFFAQAGRLQFRHVGFDYCAYGADVEVDFPGVGSLRQQFCLSGGGESIVEGARSSLSLQETCVIPAGARVEAHYSASYRQLVMRVDPGPLQSKLGALLGEQPAKALEIGGGARLRSPELCGLRRLALLAAQEFDALDSQASPLFLAEFEQTLMVAFLCAHQHNFSHLLRTPTPGIGPRQIKQAEAFIESNWSQPLTLEAIAEAVDVSARGIFHAFKQRHGCSPMAFLKETRLKRSRQMLSDRNGGATVMSVASACGFMSQRHFVREYKIKFGEAPSDTLARA